MEIYQGKTIQPGVAFAKTYYYAKDNNGVKKISIGDTKSEISRYYDAKKIAVYELSEIKEVALKNLQNIEADIFDAQAMLLNDEEYENSIKNVIEGQKVNAEYAVLLAEEKYIKLFADMNDDYIKARISDIEDISERLIRILKGTKDKNCDLMEPTIVVADELTPSDVVNFNKDNLAGIVLENGTENSHVAILAKALLIPTIYSVKGMENYDKKMALLDAINGVLYIEPDEKTINEVSRLKAQCEQLSISDEYGCEHFDFFRSEILFLKKDNYPTEEEQLDEYRCLAKDNEGNNTIIRTIDIGADKMPSYIKGKPENNPAMGLRGIRFCIERPDIFKTQLKAILRAAYYEDISVMYPMITSKDEVVWAKKIVDEVAMELKNEGIDYRIPKQGIMIETPAAVMISDELAELVDFFSIGINDLTQFTLAVDRNNIQVDALYDINHDAVAKMIQIVIDNANRAGIRVGICGVR